MIRIASLFFSLAATLSLCSAVASAATINIDFDNPSGNSFGSPTTAYTGDGVVPGGPNQWNQIFTGSTAATPLINSDGTSAAGIGVAVSRQGDLTSGMDFVTGNNIQSFGRNIASSNAPNTVFDTNAGLFRDWVFANAGQNNEVIGIQVTGLPAGDYAFYAYALEYSDQGFSRPGTLAVSYGTSASANNVAFNDVSGTASIVNSAAAAVGFNEGGNYAKLTATVAAGETFYIFGDFDTPGQAASFNGLQIVSVPEPASCLLLLFSSFAMIAHRRRRC